MGVEKHMTEARLHKTTQSVDLYRPPPLRNHLKETLATNLTTNSSPTASSSSENNTQSTSKSCTTSPIHANENCNNFENPANITVNATAEGSSSISRENEITTAETNGLACEQQKQQQQQLRQQKTTSRRERRPDRAVYIPRARRSQTTPPTTTATTTNITTQTPATTTMCNSSSINSHQQQLPISSEITTALSVTVTTSPKTDEIINNGKTVKKLKSNNSSTNGSSNKERKERIKKSTTTVQTTTTNTTKISTKSTDKFHLNKDQEEAELNFYSSNSNNTASSPQSATVVVIENSKVIINNLNCDNSADQKPTTKEETTETIYKNSIINNSPSEQNFNNIENSHIIQNSAQINETMNTNNRNKVIKKRNSNSNNIENAPNLRIEDFVATREKQQQLTLKCDNDEQELQRASKEINRSNRRIIKQTFTSDVLEIPEKILNDTIQHMKSNTVNTMTTTNIATSPASTLENTTEEEEEDEEEDDWEHMFDETGECLDPKIIQELTASVGKVKIELPKMDYNTYLTKQTILNEEEFPHVLEVSNFPIEFKNQDLMMIFSPYKESGFDIKWVDDTHALAVFSSPRVAAEVLTLGHPFVVLKPLAEATLESRLKAKKCAASLQPYRTRPVTCAALARRLVSGALGVRLKTAAEDLENERRVLREAKERKLLAAKQRDEAWES